MNAPVALPRSPELMNRDDSALLVVDMQAKLLPLIPGAARLIWNVGRLLDGARLLGVELAATEQYPQGLGPTTPELANRLGPIPAKTAFSACECADIFTGWRDKGIWKILVCGIETHV
jgi:nicotinamidase-related amidase